MSDVHVEHGSSKSEARILVLHDRKCLKSGGANSFRGNNNSETFSPRGPIL